MYHPTFIVKKNGVPLISKKEINIIGENFIRDFQPGALTDPGPVDIERFMECYLGMTLDYQYLSHNGIYLGMTIFNDTDKVVVYSPETDRAEYISAKARTCIIDPRLLAENQRHRCRFTMGHECGHDIFHPGYYSYNPGQMTLFEDSHEPMIRCRVDDYSNRRKDPKTWNEHDTMEWQANYLSSALLMPASAVRIVADRYNKNGVIKNPYTVIFDMETTFDVSREAATYRLIDLGYLSNSNYIAVDPAPLDWNDIIA